MPRRLRPPRSHGSAGSSETAVLSDLLSHIAAGVATSRADLARVTGLARSTIAQRVDHLIATNLVAEEQTSVSTGGRPPQRLRLNQDAGVILAADIDLTHCRLAIADLAGHSLLPHTIVPTKIDKGPRAVLPEVCDGFARLLALANRSPADIRGVGVSVPGPVEHSTGTVIRPPIMPGWDNYRIPNHFADYTAPTLVDNDVNLMALAEHRLCHPDIDHLLFVRVDAGIGCGIISGGTLHRGAQGAAGDIGHIRLRDESTPCACGNPGCLEAVAGGAALAASLTAAGIPADTAADVTRLAAAGNTATRAAVRAAAHRIGEVLAAVVSFYNPALIVIGGELANLDEGLLTGIRTTIYDRALPLATRSLQIEASRLGAHAAATGAILLARQHILSPAGLDKLLSQHHQPPANNQKVTTGTQ
jgi:predicted NBD/HSP70 family sugar kinase